MKLTYLFMTLLLVITATVEARRGGGGRSSRGSFTTSSGNGSRNREYYSGIVVIPAGDGTYYTGYGDSCPNGCAVNERCGTEDECAWYANPTIFWYFFGAFFVAVCCFAGYMNTRE